MNSFLTIFHFFRAVSWRDSGLFGTQNIGLLSRCAIFFCRSVFLGEERKQSTLFLGHLCNVDSLLHMQWLTAVDSSRKRVLIFEE